MSELVVKAGWYCLFEADLSAECKFLADIKEAWGSLDTSSQADIITLDKDLQGRQEAVPLYMELLTKRNRRNALAIRWQKVL